MRPAWRAALLLWLLLAAWLAQAEPLRLGAQAPHVSLEGRLEHLADPGGKLEFNAVLRRPFRRLPDFRSLGYGTAAHWFRAALAGEPGAPERWVLVIGAPDLEEVDVWVREPGGSFAHYPLGYHRPFANRPLPTREFAVPVQLGPQGGEVYFRVRTRNAINVHAQLWQVQAFSASETRGNFARGLYFGILVIAVALYLILGARLRDAVMAAYAGYLAGQTLLHLGSSGFLPVMLPQAPFWVTDVLPRGGWVASGVFLPLMWDRLLRLGQRLRQLHWLFLATMGWHLMILPAALIPPLVGPWVLRGVQAANWLGSLTFFISMGLLGLYWWRTRRAEYMLYLVAFIVPAFGSVVNTAVNMGLLQQNPLTYNFYPVAMLVHVLVMSVGLAMRLQQVQRDKQAAEQAAALAASRAEEQRRFVAMLSHEFGNPLAAIDRAAQVMQVKGGSDLPPSEQQRLEQIRRNVAMLSGYVDNFLMTEALDHGALVVQRESCAVRGLLESAIDLQGEAAAGRVRLVEAPAEEIRFVLDPTFIRVALGNLLANALRYAPPGSQVELGARLDAEGLRLRVADSGPGLAEDELQRLGSPYFRATSSLGTKGSGLGYYFTRHIVQAHGGSLAAANRPQGGLQVEIFLPARA